MELRILDVVGVLHVQAVPDFESAESGYLSWCAARVAPGVPLPFGVVVDDCGREFSVGFFARVGFSPGR
jgi:hypothetical protein